jgi:hypothetical protein
METRNFIGNLRVEIRAVGIPTALRRAGKVLAAPAEKGDRKKAAAIKAISIIPLPYQSDLAM